MFANNLLQGYPTLQAFHASKTIFFAALIVVRSHEAQSLEKMNG